MRARIFKKFLASFEKYTPSIIKRLQIQILLCATARAFDRPGKMVCHLSADRALAAYAAYTRDCVETRAVAGKRIYQSAYRLGRLVRRISGFTESADLERLVFYLYSNIGIRVTGQLPGEIVIPACYFSSLYTPRLCRIMSLMDWGIIAGICGGGKLVFTQRLTQGCGSCRACLIRKGVHRGEQCSK